MIQMRKKCVLIAAFASLHIILSTIPSSALNTTGQGTQRRIAITFDDLPATNGNLEVMSYVTTNLLRSIRLNDVPAIGFVNESKLYRRGEIDARTNLLWQWLEAGLELGNHTFSHIYINDAPFAAYKEDLIRGETVTRMLLEEKGKRLRYYRHTQLRTGPTPQYKKALEELLAERGYVVAPVTIDNNDYIFADIYSKARARGDKETMRRIAAEYIPYMESVLAHFEKLSMKFLGREVRQTLLLHANELNADHFDDLIHMMAGRGYIFITLEEALKDEAYRLPDAQVGRGLSWLHRWMIAKGMQMQPEPREPEWVARLFETYPQ